MTTKTELEAQVAQLQEQLAAAQSATPDSAPRLPGFADRVWLPGDIDEVVTNQDGTTWKPVKYGTTKNGSRFFEWKTSVSHLDKKTNKRIYSKTRIPFKAWNEQADQIMNMIKDGTRLVDITANYLPDAWNYEGQDFSQDFWYVTSVDPFVRNEPAEVQGELNA
jgi:hypothetical protein